jgi:hypothetical protein
MVQRALYLFLALSFGFTTPVFASLFPQVPQSTIEFVFHTSGMDLVDQLVAAVEGGPRGRSVFKTVIAATPEEAQLAHEFDRMLERVFDEMARNPSEETAMWATNQLFFIFARHVGGEVLAKAKNQWLVADTIRQFIQPLYVRDPASCVTLLDPRTAGTVH